MHGQRFYITKKGYKLIYMKALIIGATGAVGSDVLFSCLGTTKKKIVAFICVHNSCRSQIAEALGKHFAGDIFESYSAGTVVVDKINQDAVRLMKKLYGIDMEANGQYSKVIDEIPAPDIAISMGCNVTCPFVGRPFDDKFALITLLLRIFT